MPLGPRRDAYRHGPSFQTLMSLPAGRSTEPGNVSHAYVAGLDWALWDYNDVNGLRNERGVRRA